jgi:hypothetical protein
MAPKKPQTPDQEATDPPGPADPGEVREFEPEPAPVQEEVAEGPADPGPHAVSQDETKEG